jgi:hypothetical protein
MNQRCDTTSDYPVKELDPGFDLVSVPAGGTNSDYYGGLSPDDDCCCRRHRARR